MYTLMERGLGRWLGSHQHGENLVSESE
jgi:hypothetical protein